VCNAVSNFNWRVRRQHRVQRIAGEMKQDERAQVDANQEENGISDTPEQMGQTLTLTSNWSDSLIAR
jgi:hypothetical protein